MNTDEIRIIEDEGRKRANFRGYPSGNTQWKRGLKGPVCPIVEGMLGEWAVGLWLNGRLRKKLFRLDMVLRKYGDGGVDLEAFGFTMDVKATPKPMVRRVDHGRLLRLPARAYIFADARNCRVVKLLGWITCERMCEVSPACRTPIQKATHYNLEPPLEELEHMADLVRRLKVESRKCR